MDSPHDEVALDAAESIDEDDPIEMIHLVLKRACEKPRAFDGLLVAFTIEPLEDGPSGPHDRRVESRHAQAAFFLELHALALDEGRD